VQRVAPSTKPSDAETKLAESGSKVARAAGRGRAGGAVLAAAQGAKRQSSSAAATKPVLVPWWRRWLLCMDAPPLCTSMVSMSLSLRPDGDRGSPASTFRRSVAEALPSQHRRQGAPTTPSVNYEV
jgi:hypothetical protein